MGKVSLNRDTTVDGDKTLTLCKNNYLRSSFLPQTSPTGKRLNQESRYVHEFTDRVRKDSLTPHSPVHWRTTVTLRRAQTLLRQKRDCPKEGWSSSPFGDTHGMRSRVSLPFENEAMIMITCSFEVRRPRAAPLQGCTASAALTGLVEEGCQQCHRSAPAHPLQHGSFPETLPHSAGGSRLCTFCLPPWWSLILLYTSICRKNSTNSEKVSFWLNS